MLGGKRPAHILEVMVECRKSCQIRIAEAGKDLLVFLNETLFVGAFFVAAVSLEIPIIFQ